jgi:predicted P-loop ATPase
VQVAAEHPYHPVRDWLRSLKWDQIPRIRDWLSRYLGANRTPYHSAVGPRFLIGMVARIMEPGCQMDNVLVLQGAQGLHALRVLASPDWYSSHISRLGSSNSMAQCRGKWLMVFAEFEAIKKVSSETARAFITQRVGRFRPPHGCDIVLRLREGVFAATTNEEKFLRDVIRDRRYWPVRTGFINLQLLEADRPQLFAEAVVHYDAGYPWHLETPELKGLATQVRQALQTKRQARLNALMDSARSQLRAVGVSK